MKNIFAYLFVILSLNSCGLLFGDNEDCIINYYFELPIDLSPANGSYKVGDTLDVIININTDSIVDVHGDRVVSIPNLNPNAWFLFPSLDTFPVRDGFFDHEIIVSDNIDFSHIAVSTLSSGYFFEDLKHELHYSILDFKIVLNKPGIYCLYAVSELWRDEDEEELKFPDRCGNGGLDAYFKYSDGITNIELLTNEHLEVENKYWIERDGQRKESKPYYFKVE